MGISDSVSLNTETMTKEDANKVIDIINKAKFFELPQESEKPKAGSADYARYKITIEDNERKHTVITNDITKSASLGQLITFLKSKKD